jgi:hypothetical protein
MISYIKCQIFKANPAQFSLLGCEAGHFWKKFLPLLYKFIFVISRNRTQKIMIMLKSNVVLSQL